MSTAFNLGLAKSTWSSIPTGGTIHNLGCSPFKQSAGLLAYATDNHLGVLSRELTPESEVQEDHGFGKPTLFSHGGSRITSISWAPDAQSVSPEAPGKAKISVAVTDQNRIYYFSKRLEGNDFDNPVTTKLIESGHTLGINGSAFNPQGGLTLATVGDDRLCRIWDVNQGQELASIQLQSPGWSVKWHPSNSQVMVSEECGKVKIFDLQSNNVIATLHSFNEGPLDADWSKVEDTLFGGISGSYYYLWTMTGIPSYGTTKNPVNHPMPTFFRFCHTDMNLFATASSISPMVSVWNQLHLDRPNTTTFQGKIGGISWLADQSVLAVANDSNLNFWKFNI